MPSRRRGPGRLNQAFASRAQTAPFRTAGRSRHSGAFGERPGFTDNLVEGEAAGEEESHVGGGGGDGLPGDALGLLAGTGEHILPAGAGDLLGHPVPGGEGRVEPLEREDAGSGRGEGCGWGRARAQVGGEAGTLGGAARGLADLLDGAGNALEVEGREGEDAGAKLLLVHDPVDLALAHGADIAEGLGDDEVGLELAQAGDIDRVGRAAGGEEVADGGVDLGLGKAARLDGGAGEDGEAARLGGVVALVGDADDLVAGADGEDDLGGAGEEGGDAHG